MTTCQTAEKENLAILGIYTFNEILKYSEAYTFGCVV